MSLAAPRTTRATSAADGRAAIVAALGTVTSLVALPAAPDNPTSGAAWPRWALSQFHGERLSVVDEHQYDVLVVLPAGYAPETITQADGLLHELSVALSPVCRIDTAEPVQITFQAGESMPGIRMRCIPRLNAREETN